MADYHVNVLATSGRLPREAAVGFLGEGIEIEHVVHALNEAGIPSPRLYFLQGDLGADILANGGSSLSRLFEDNVRDAPVAALREGTTLVAVLDVSADDRDVVQSAMADAGVVRRRYFGRFGHNAGA